MCCNSIFKCRVSTDLGLILPRAGAEGVWWGWGRVWTARSRKTSCWAIWEESWRKMRKETENFQKDCLGCTCNTPFKFPKRGSNLFSITFVFWAGVFTEPDTMLCFLGEKSKGWKSSSVILTPRTLPSTSTQPKSRLPFLRHPSTMAFHRKSHSDPLKASHCWSVNSATRSHTGTVFLWFMPICELESRQVPTFSRQC